MDETALVRHGSMWPANQQTDQPALAAIGATGPGFFGRMFDLPAFTFDDQALRELAHAMSEASALDEESDNPLVPAGFTYLGQFVDHDITFDVFSGMVPPADAQPAAVPVLRTPSLDLDSVYGRGPALDAQLYQQGSGSEGLFRIGRTSNNPSGFVNGVCMPTDLPRDNPLSAGSGTMVATIGDPRNDENLVVAQMHLAFLKFHNKIMAMLAAEPNPGPWTSRFDKARKLVRWHYQWIVLHDFVRRLVMPAVLDDVLMNGRRFYRFEDTPPHTPFMPLEFSVAAYRLGHSMIREEYDYNRVFKRQENPAKPTFGPASLELLFMFTGSRFPGDPQGRAPIPSNWTIDWRRFFELDANVTPNLARKLDTKLAPTLANLPAFRPEPGQQPTESPELAHRNLFRGRLLELPSGQAVAGAIGAPELTADELASGPEGPVVRAHGFEQQTPLWYYILKEAEVKGRGIRLGAVGSRIVSEVFVGLLEGDADSFMAQDPNWRPTLKGALPGHFTMADLLRVVGDINPIGDLPEDTDNFTCP